MVRPEQRTLILDSIAGSCLHALRALHYPRWEDFDYEQLDEDGTNSCLYWLGDGMTLNEKTMTGDSECARRTVRVLAHQGRLGAWYLDERWIDGPPG